MSPLQRRPTGRLYSGLSGGIATFETPYEGCHSTARDLGWKLSEGLAVAGETPHRRER
jgi:hypothetical protein